MILTRKMIIPLQISRGQSLSCRPSVLYEVGTDVLSAIWMNFRYEVPCHGSGGRSPTSRTGSLASIPGQPVCDMSTKWHWSSFPPRTSVFPCQYSSSNAPYSFIHLHAALSRTNGRGLGTFQNQRSLRYQEALKSKVLSLFKPEVSDFRTELKYNK